MVSGYFLNLVKQQVGQFQTSTCTIQRRTPALDAYGFGDSGAAGWETTDEDIACRILPVHDRDRQGIVAAGEEGRTFYRLILPTDTDIQDGDRVLIDDLIYEALQLETAQTDAAFKSVRLARLENG